MNDRYTLKIAADTNAQQRRVLAEELSEAFTLTENEAEALLEADTLVLARDEAATLVARCHDLGIRVTLVGRQSSAPKPRLSRTWRFGLAGLALAAVLALSLALMLPAPTTPQAPAAEVTPALAASAVTPSVPGEVPEVPDLFAASRDAGPGEVRAALAAQPVDARDAYGQTPLMYAAGANSPEVLAVLLAWGAQVDAQSDADWTPLMYAARNVAHPEVTRQLLGSGADPSPRNANGQSARDIALAYNNAEAAQALAEAELRGPLPPVQTSPSADAPPRTQPPDPTPSPVTSVITVSPSASPAVPPSPAPAATPRSSAPIVSPPPATQPVTPRPAATLPAATLPDDASREALERCLADWESCGTD